MAILIPDTPKDCTRSERLVFQRMGAELDKEWVVLHSLGLSEHASKRRGEADIVVISTRGIFVLEIKGGHVSCRAGKWYFGTPGTNEVERKEDPWSQASGAMFAVIHRIKAAAPEMASLLFGYGVVMPMERFEATGAEIDPELLLDKRKFNQNLALYVANLERRWKQIYKDRGLREPRRPTREDIKRIKLILRPDIESAFSLGSWLNNIDQELLALTNEQIRISRRLDSNARMIVTGKAGTGKTILAVNRAIKLAKDGHSVLYLCFNQLLARHVTQTIDEAVDDSCRTRLTVRHLHGHYKEAIRAAGLENRLDAATESGELFFGVTYPQLYVEALMELEPSAFDAVVVDEAQDILTVEHLEALDLTVDGGLDHGRWHLFLDPQQNIYGKFAEAAEKRLAHLSLGRDELLDNCRNTREVAYQTSILSSLDVAVEGSPSGPSCECVFYANTADFLKQLEAKIRNLLKQEVNPRDIIILSTRRFENSLISSVRLLAGLSIKDVGETPTRPTIAFSTMHAFKGLERGVVLAIDLAEIGQEERSMLHYAGLSRARTLLVPFVPSTCASRYSDLVQSFGRRQLRS